MSADVEFELMLLKQYYHLMKVYYIDIPSDENDIVSTLHITWAQVSEKARYINFRLVKTKLLFTEKTKNLISDFAKEMVLFAERFDETGPLSCGNDSHRSFLAMNIFRKLLIQYEARRLDLVAAEKLFDLPISVYPDFTNVSLKMQMMEPIFDLYEQQLKSRDIWGETLWVSLDIKVLQDGADRYIGQMRKMSKAIRALSVHKAVELNLKEFRDSLPLLSDLKHDALRERHWNKLMHQTNIIIDMKPDSFTLQSLFDMKLNEHVDVIGDILNSAIKELAIEKGIKEVEELWNGVKFTIIKYMKGNEDHGVVIGPVDEITVALDDNCMQLQGMAASRFIGPFLNTVQKWEQVLSTISEVRTVQYFVFRKL